jgi:transposase
MHFRSIDRKTAYLLPPSVEEWLPEDHLARFIVEVVEGLDLIRLEQGYAGRGSTAYHPAQLLSLLVYGYATGVFSSRKIESATYDSVAFRFIAAGSHPDHDTLAAFRRCFLDELSGIFVQVLELAQEMKLLKLGTLSLDGTKVHANASRHSALSYGHAQKIEAQLEAEVKQMLARAEAADQEPLPNGMSLPKELARREERLAAIRQAKAQLETRAAERDVQQKADFDAKMKAREDKTTRTGNKPRGKPPTPPSSGVRPSDQINLTDADSRIMPATGKGFEQSYNAQAAVDTESMLIVATGMAQVATDKQQVEPMLEALAELPEALGCVKRLLADNGYFSAANVERCVEAKIEPLLAAGRDGHHPHWEDRFTEPPPLVEPASAVERMKHRLKTRKGRARYALRKQTIEPVFGIIKSVMRFRQFLLRGLEAVRGEWSLVTMAWNIKRMAVMAA